MFFLWGATALAGGAYDGTDFLDGGDNLDLDRTAPAAISMWYQDDAASPGSFVALLTKMENTGDLRGWGVLRASDDDLMFRLRNSSGNSLQVVWSRVVGSWTHLLIVYDGSQNTAGVDVWTNGSADSVTSELNNLSLTIANSASLTFAGRDGGNITWTGSLAEVGIWTGSGVDSMGQTEATALSGGVRPPNLAGFTGQLVLYHAGRRAADESDSVGPTLTNNGATFDYTDHPPVVYVRDRIDGGLISGGWISE